MAMSTPVTSPTISLAICGDIPPSSCLLVARKVYASSMSVSVNGISFDAKVFMISATIDIAFLPSGVMS
jgi:hypothetical protein